MHANVGSLIRYVDGTTPGPAARRIRSHLESCPGCREREREVRRILELMASDRLLEPSEASVLEVLRAFRRAPQPLPDWALALKERVARVVFDTLDAPRTAFAGARHGGTSRRLRFEAGALELDVLVEARGDRRRLTGQVLALGPSPAPLSRADYLVSAAGNLVASGQTDEHGELVSEIVRTGEIEIRVAAEPHLALFRIPEGAGEPARD